MSKSNSFEQTPRRVVITGIGVISAIGVGKDAFWNSLREGKSGIRKISSFDTSSYKCNIAGEIEGFDASEFIPSQEARRIDKFAQFAVAAARLGIEDSKLDFDGHCSGSIGVILGTSVGTLCYAEQQIALFYEKGVKRINPFFATSVIPSSATTQIMLNLKIKGPARTVSTACASGTCAVGEGYREIRRGSVDVILAGASEAPITPLVLSTLGSIELLSPDHQFPERSYRPFSRDAQGFVLGEGSAILVLEDLEHALRRDARIYAEVVGFDQTSDAFHVMAFDPTLQQPVRAIKGALEEAKLQPSELGYVNVHGIALPDHDRCEVAILKMALGDVTARIPISATKPMTGHTLGAGGAMELVACCLMMKNHYLHPTLNLSNPDPLCDLDFIPNVGRPNKVDAMLSLSFGFGGYNAACVIRRYSEIR